MRSMTGFGRGAVAGEGFSVTIELKTVNNRFLDINLRLGNEVSALESDIKRWIGQRVARGRVEVNLQYDRSEEVSYDLNRNIVGGYLSVMKVLKDEFGLAGEPDLNVVARLPNIFSTRKEEPSADFIPAIEKAFTIALDELESMRNKEGELLAIELDSRLAEIETHLGPIEAESANIADEHRERLNKKVAEIVERAGMTLEIDQGRLAQEVAYLADRSDISEEIARLKAHTEHFRQIMREDRDVGKRLDFLTQELNREANTVTSKTGSIAVKENALAIKSEIEKIREQLQNVE
ncbi:MAG: YicC family protein [Blastocatellia bacterium]|nr:YicC family protein [Blastocatellia bacterium]